MAKNKSVPVLDEPAPIFEGFSPEAFRFLHGLKKNNNKAWFEEHRDDYEIQVRNPAKSLVASMGEYFRQNKMPLVANAKTSLFRINRDIRFSKDKSPYKTHIGLSFPLEGAGKEEWSGFYLGFEPAAKGKGISVFAGGGVYMPPPPYLKRIRTKIASKHKELEKLLAAKQIAKLFPKQLEGESLKRIPVGFSEEHPAAEWLKLKNFMVSTELKDQDLLSEDLPETLGERFKVALPVILFLGRA